MLQQTGKPKAQVFCQQQTSIWSQYTVAILKLCRLLSNLVELASQAKDPTSGPRSQLVFRAKSDKRRETSLIAILGALGTHIVNLYTTLPGLSGEGSWK